MNGNSKREMVGRFMRTRMREVLGEAALSIPTSAEWLKANAGYFERLMEDAVTQKYRLLELQDIMDWKDRQLK